MNKPKSCISFVAAAVTVCVGFGVLANTGLRDETAGVRDYTVYTAENNENASVVYMTTENRLARS